MPVTLLGERATAVVDDARHPRYRYHLTREFEEGEGTVAFVMLNPSSADHQCNDDTVRQCIRLARSWRYRTLEVGNLYALYAPDPAELRCVDDPIGRPYNDDYLRCIATRCDNVVVAWGGQGSDALGTTIFKDRSNHVLQLLRCAMESACRQPRVHRLVWTATEKGYPLHPARKSVSRLVLQEWDNPRIE